MLLILFGKSDSLARLMPEKAHKELDQIYKGIYEDTASHRIHKNDILFVKPGERIPADSVIVSGESYLDESKFTGEAQWLFKQKGDKVLGGSLNGEGALRICVEKVKEESYLYKVIRLLQQGRQAKTELELFTERALGGLLAVILSVSILVFAGWLLKGRDLHFALERFIACLLVACPPAMGLGIALINNFFINHFAEKGFFICRDTAFAKANRVSLALFEKTGILTKGKYEVIYAHGVNKRYNERSILKWAAAVEQKAHHPIAQALVLKAEELNLKLPRVDNFEQLEGQGAQGIVNGLLLKVVGIPYLREHGISEPEGLKVKSNLTRIFLVKNEAVLGVIGLEDNIREGAYQAVRQMQKQGIKCWLITGDSREVAGNVAEDLGMSGFSAELTSREKEAKIKEWQLEGEVVCLAADSTRELAALHKANLSLAMGVKNNLTAEKMDICCLNPNPGEIANFFLFARKFAGRVQSMLGWLFLYSLVSLFLATGVLSGLGILVSPVVAAALMAGSSLLVILGLSLPFTRSKFV
jgi:Cu2+-exporting ATPase